LAPPHAGRLAGVGVVEDGAERGAVQFPEIQEVPRSTLHQAGFPPSNRSQVRSSFSIASRASSAVNSSDGSNRTQLSPPPAMSSFSSRAAAMNSRLLGFSLRPIS